MREVLRHALTIAAKDLTLELRSRTVFLSALVFTALVLAIFHFARDPTAVSTVDLAPGILWITFTFAGLLGLNRAFTLEKENRALDGLLLSPASRTALFLGKTAANLVFVGAVEAIALPLFALFFNVPILPVLGPLVGVIALATVGFVFVGTLLSYRVKDGEQDFQAVSLQSGSPAHGKPLPDLYEPTLEGFAVNAFTL